MHADIQQLLCFVVCTCTGADRTQLFCDMYPDNAYKDHCSKICTAYSDIIHGQKGGYPGCNVPFWIEDKLANHPLGQEVMRSFEAPSSQTVRVNTLISSVERVMKEMERCGVVAKPSHEVATAIHVVRGNFTQSPGYLRGHFEVQDLSSQILCALINPTPDDYGLDFCAGAGGKTLALGALQKNKGKIVASDIDRKRLMRGRQRAQRAGAKNIYFADQHELSSNTTFTNFDWVLVDAPCSGSGTWHRNPDMRWFITVEDLQKYQICQREVLAAGASRVRRGGLLVYATCSLFEAENTQNVEWFLDTHPEFRCVDVRLRHLLPGPWQTYSDRYLRLLPLQQGRDGFFASVMRRI